jgi:ribosome maturation factor RimP
MLFAHEKLPGLDRERVLAAVAPILAAHRVQGVELTFKTDRGGWVLEVTIEKPEERVPGAGITIDLCSEISRDLSTALDVADCIPHRYRLEVGSPGVERALYTLEDYARFAGQRARLKLRAPRSSEYVLSGVLSGVTPEERIALETERAGRVELSIDEIESGRLQFAWGKEPAAQRRNKHFSGDKPGRRVSGRERRPARRT